MSNYKGQLEGFPKEVVELMLVRQQEQGNVKDITVFEKDNTSDKPKKGFDWNLTIEKLTFWNEVIYNKNFDLFFKKYPKNNNMEDLNLVQAGDFVKSPSNNIGLVIQTSLGLRVIFKTVWSELTNDLEYRRLEAPHNYRYIPNNWKDSWSNAKPIFPTTKTVKITVDKKEVLNTKLSTEQIQQITDILNSNNV